MTAQYFTWSMYPASSPVPRLDSRSSRRKSTTESPATSPIADHHDRTSSESSSRTLRQTVTSPASTPSASASPTDDSRNRRDRRRLWGGAAHHEELRQGSGGSEPGLATGLRPGHLLRSNSTSANPSKQKRSHIFRHTRTSSSSSVGSNTNPTTPSTALAGVSVPGRTSHETSLRLPGLLHRLQPDLASGAAASSTSSARFAAAPRASERHPQSPASPVQRQTPHFGSYGDNNQNQSPTSNQPHRPSSALGAAVTSSHTRPTDAGTAPGAGDGNTHVRSDVTGAQQGVLAGQAPLSASPASPASPHGAHPTSGTTASSPATSTAATPITANTTENDPANNSTRPRAQAGDSTPHSHKRSQKQHKQKLAKLAATTDFSHLPAQRIAPQRHGLSASELKYVVGLQESDHHPAGKTSKINPAGQVGGSSATSLSSASGGTARTLWTTMTTTSSDPSGSADTLNTLVNKPFVLRNGRTYLNDVSLPYPLPVDLTELHRQSLRTLLLIQIFGAPVCSPALMARPPSRVLEVGCGSGFWSMMCHRYFRERGHTGISFTGLDIAPLAPGSGPSLNPSSPSSPSSPSTHDASAKPDRDMNWRFVQHDMRQTPFPLASAEFDLVMVKDMSLATTNALQQDFMDEYLRLLRPGGTLEIWESDHTIRMLRPHIPETKLTITSSSVHDDEEQEAARLLGAYLMSANTPLSPPLNNFLVEYNAWIVRALENRDLSAVPCTRIGPNLLQESDSLADVRSRRLAIPLSDVRWEKENVSGVVTKDGKSYIDTKSAKGKGTGAEDDKRNLTAGQAALRRTALMTVVQQVQSLEPLLRDVSGKRQDEWDIWISKMMNDLLKEKGTTWGECLEVGAWWAKKKKR